MRIHFEARLQESRSRYLLVPLVALVVAFCLIAVVLWLIGVSPLAVYKEIVETSFTSKYGLGDTLAQATPLILTSLAVAFAFKMKVLSVGAEGQLIIGAVFAASAGIILGGLPAVILIPAVVLAGALGGVIWALVPALLAAYWDVSIIITTLLLNFVAFLCASYLIFGSNSFLTENLSNFPQGRPIAMEARLSSIGDQSVTGGLAVAVGAAVVLWLVLTYTRFGYNVRVCGDAPKAARYAGINVRVMTILVVLGSGALAGLAGAVEVSGRTHALDPYGLALGLGYTGIIVAVLARLNPFGVIAVSVIFGGLINSGSALQSLPGNSVPAEIVSVMIGTVLILALMGDVFVRYQLKTSRTGTPPLTSKRQVDNVD